MTRSMTRSIRAPFAVLLAACAAALATPSPALAVPGFKLGVAGLLNLGVSSVTSGVTTTKGGLGFGGGLIGEIAMFELDALIVSRKTDTTVGATTTSSSVTHLDIPLLYRFDAGPLSIGAGGYLSAPFQGGGPTNYGLVLSPKVSIPASSFFVDARYLLGLTKDAAGNTHSDLQLLLGYALM